MSNVERLRKHPKVREVIETPDNTLVVRLATGEDWEFFGNIQTAAAEALSQLDGDDA